MSTEGYSGDQGEWDGLDLAQKKKLAWVANRKRVALVDVEIEAVPVDPRRPQSWLVRGPGSRRNSPEATDIHDNDPTDPVYGWDWDGADGYFVTDTNPTDLIWQGVEG